MSITLKGLGGSENKRSDRVSKVLFKDDRRAGCDETNEKSSGDDGAREAVTER